MSMETPARSFAPFEHDEAVRAVIDGFLARTLPAAAWSHQAHLAVGLWHVETAGEQAAGDLLAERIRGYNEAVGTPNNDMRGYHDTVTRYYAWAAARYLETVASLPLAARTNGFVESPFGAKQGIFHFWSRDVLFSVAARRAYRPPDLRPLDAAALRAAMAALT